MLGSLFFLARECGRNIRRNTLLSAATLGAVSVCLIVFGAVGWGAIRLHEIAARQPGRFEEIDAFLRADLSRDDAKELRERLRALPEVRSVTLVPRESAWRGLQRDEPTLSRALPDNPLPDALQVFPRRAADTSAITAKLRNAAVYPEIEAVRDSSQMVSTMIGAARVVKLIGGGVACGLLVATVFIIFNTIRLTVYARRREIRIMQLVGATAGFIRLPLVLEGLFHGVVGGALAALMLLAAARITSQSVAAFRSPLLGDVPTRVGALQVVCAITMAGAAIGLSGSYLSMRRFLRRV
jgi:cell division transport system permease protein